MKAAATKGTLHDQNNDGRCSFKNVKMRRVEGWWIASNTAEAIPEGNGGSSSSSSSAALSIVPQPSPQLFDIAKDQEDDRDGSYPKHTCQKPLVEETRSQQIVRPGDILENEILPQKIKGEWKSGDDPQSKTGGNASPA